ncbi:MAG: DUF1820 family protein [Candidatus Thiodiazotropha sp. (ex Ctena orbiculata)]|uniref:DUF1820 family protein n=1 Tax=Candidatus Thiodiazotropha taylori TaxID=2792791 RepID=A0A944QSQ7_9GAMM|nr:DUF1820 family protein [Candidatus Thiodiazotropha taylori]MBT3026615.1 DUF1820 family protein [Candidatus Thiodiazotropha taylori]MBT3034263.1 DUF1820 family protein [Candidatus Thiodiazotropha taylori]PUB87761.1 MAG: DUF1820 domain-containing protein [gamma proteobacterium symbiont of Ctena orbiculata]
MRVFKVTFLNQGKVYEIFAKTVRQGELYGFVEVEGLIFQETSSVVVDPSAEKLKDEFSGVHRTRIPIHAVIRIDEVEKSEQGPGKIIEIDSDSNITPFPNPMFDPKKRPDK